MSPNNGTAYRCTSCGQHPCVCETVTADPSPAEAMNLRAGFESQLASLINRHSLENGSNTPDFILAGYLRSCLEAFDVASVAREGWYDCFHAPGGVRGPKRETDADRRAWLRARIEGLPKGWIDEAVRIVTSGDRPDGPLSDDALFRRVLLRLLCPEETT